MIRGGMRRFAPDDLVKGFIWTIRVSMSRFAPNDFVKVSYGRCGVAWGGSFLMIPQRFDQDGPGKNVEVCSGRVREGLTESVGVWMIS